jgi:cysteinyl-tRNA synthetase
LDAFYRLFEQVERITGQDPYAGGERLETNLHGQAEDDAQWAFVTRIFDLRLRFLEAMDDDFNTGGAVGVLFEMASAINRFADAAKIEIAANDKAKPAMAAATQTLRSLAKLLGLFERRPRREGAGDQVTDDLMRVLIDSRAEARRAKQYALADLIRDRLGALKITLEDRPDGTTWRRAT